jgi:general secretion pathway protein I
LSLPVGRDDRRAEAGFTLVEVLVSLAILAVALSAIGSLMASTVRGTRSIDEHFSLAETARAIEAALPDRKDLNASFAGARGDYRWRVDVLPFRARFVDPSQPTPWLPQAVVITVQSPDGPILRINTIRLRPMASK